MKASVVIPTRNRAATLEGCLTSLHQQDLPHDQFEVLVVDNGSTDATRQTAERFADSLPVRILYESQLGLHAARHAGLRSAQAEILVFIDDDVLTEPGWLKSIVNAFEDDEVVLVGGNNLPLFESPPPEWLRRWWDTTDTHGRTLPYLSILDYGNGAYDVNPHLIWGCNFSIRRATLLEAGGFHPDALPKERLRWRGDGETYVSEWIRRAGLRARFDSGASVRHIVPDSRMTRDYFRKRAFAQGISDSYSDIRRTHNSKAARMYRIKHWLLTQIKILNLKTAAFGDSAQAEYVSIRLEVLQAWRKGYAYHQSEVRKDPALLAWVTKKTYM